MYTSGVFAYGIPVTWRAHIPIRLAFEAFQGICSASLDRQHNLFEAGHWFLPLLQRFLMGTVIAGVVMFATEVFRWGGGLRCAGLCTFEGGPAGVAAVSLLQVRP